MAGQYIYVPGLGGTVWKLNKGAGQVQAHINPFGNSVDPNTFVSGPLTADSH
jgi:hypothetical protein